MCVCVHGDYWWRRTLPGAQPINGLSSGLNRSLSEAWRNGQQALAMTTSESVWRRHMANPATPAQPVCGPGSRRRPALLQLQDAAPNTARGAAPAQSDSLSPQSAPHSVAGCGGHGAGAAGLEWWNLDACGHGQYTYGCAVSSSPKETL